MKIPPEAIIQMSGLPASMKQQILQKLQPTQADQAALQMQMQTMQKQIEVLASTAALNMAKAGQAQAEAQTAGVEAQATMLEAQRGPAQQIDTVADMSKARLDDAKADEIRHKIDVGAHVPQAAPIAPPPPPPPGLFELNLAKAREADARAGSAYMVGQAADASRLKTLLEARTIDEAPPGMLVRPPPRPPPAKK
jgi:hypothetical protein